ncbi:MAG: hypothetical protein M1378_07875 [Bacteroidetes bacterium]|nr:hypothetical protein [Bacteroidota bacterium]
MLNEGYALCKSLQRCGIQPANRHPDIKEPGKKDGLVVGLNKKGEVARLEYRSAEEIANLWTVREGMHNSFPVLKIQRPLWKVGKDDPFRKKIINLKANDEEKRNLLNNQHSKVNITSDQTNWWKRLHERVTELKPFFETNNPDYRAVPQLMNRFLLVPKLEDFLEELLNRIIQFQKEIPYPLFETILVGNKWVEKDKEYSAEIPLVLDVNDWDDKTQYSNRVASKRVEDFVSECLFKRQGMSDQDGKKGNHGVSALSGKEQILENDKFPCPKLPIIGNAYLFSVNDQTPCQSRYKRSSTNIIPVGRKEANAIQGSLKWITGNDRKGKTWCSVPGSSDGESDLLMVYLENKPNMDVNKALLLGGVSKNDFTESQYEEVAGAVVKALKGEEVIKSNDLIRLFVLRKADPGRTQVSLQRAYTKGNLISADEDWRVAAKNGPKVFMRFFRKEIEKTTAKQENISTLIKKFLQDDKSKVVYLAPHCPFPADLVRLTQKQWIRFGQDFSPVAGCSLGDVYDIFFARRNEQKYLIEDLLNMTILRTHSLLIAIGQADHKKDMSGFNTEARFTTLTTISALAIYLYKLGIKKEDYMKDTFFYVGRFLSLVDTLHFEYCDKVRGGSIPPQLLGNAHLQVALDNPTSAFDMLSRRIGVYQAWTRKEQGERAKLARWAVGQIGKVTDFLAEQNLPDSTTSPQRAQILLGYLSRPERKTENDSESSTEKIAANK